MEIKGNSAGSLQPSDLRALFRSLDNVSFIDIVGLTDKYIARNGYRHGMWFEKSLRNMFTEKTTMA
jgi:hypothetical protein